MKLSHALTLTLTAIAAAAGVVQQYALGMPEWAHITLLAVFAVLTSLGIPNLTQLAPAPPAPPAAPVTPSAGATTHGVAVTAAPAQAAPVVAS